MVNEQLSMLDPLPKTVKDLSRGSSFSISKTINAKPQSVCDKWLIPVLAGEWMFANDKVAELNGEVRKGGEFNYKVSIRGTKLVFNGNYQILDIPNKIALSWESSRAPGATNLITVNFNADGARTKMKLTMRLDPRLDNRKPEIRKEWSERCSRLASKFE